jgi:hypothetical protein
MTAQNPPWEMGPDEVQELLALSPRERAASFFQLVADWEGAWGLKDAQGWVVSRETDGLPLWPHPALAEACAIGPWTGSLPKAVAVDELLADLLPLLAEDGLRIAVFPSPGDPGVLLTPAELAERLEQELQTGR